MGLFPPPLTPDALVLLLTHWYPMSEFIFFTGPILVGTQLNWALLGALALQVYKFYSTFRGERLGIKALVYWLLFLDLAQTAFSSHFAFATLANGWGDPTVFTLLPWSSCSIPVLAGLISVSVQLFFSWRIYILEGDKNRCFLAICVIIVVLALMQSLSAIVNGIRFAFSSQAEYFLQLVVGVKIWLIGSAVCDVVIALTMITILTRYRQMTPWKSTDNIVTKLIYHTVETGAITAVAAIIEVILFLVYPQYNFHEVPAFILGKLYSNVVLATLNARTPPDWNKTIYVDTQNVTGTENHQLQWRSPTPSIGGETVTGSKVQVPTITVIDSNNSSPV
ncbi:hypothetical protein DFH06DRAFT_1208873 [Mycena polygramma]|nr:hypothetical protein DFH06DRAFT_1208873 [Mycena polygramma]